MISANDTDSKGLLAVCATPIGNLGDVTPRVLEMLKASDVVLAEDTRVTRKLLSHFGISARLERCDENVSARLIPDLLNRISAGQTVTLVSDAGMPCVSDPGQNIVRAVREAGLAVTVLPGASAVTTAVAGCGIPASAFYFGGFLPRRDSRRRALLESLSELEALLVFFESAHRLAASLKVIAEVFPNRQACMAREISKVHEEYLVMDAPALAQEIDRRKSKLKGEIVLIIGPPAADENKTKMAEPADVLKVATELAGQGKSASAIAKFLVAEFGISRNEAYEISVEARQLPSGPDLGSS